VIVLEIINRSDLVYNCYGFHDIERVQNTYEQYLDNGIADVVDDFFKGVANLSISSILKQIRLREGFYVTENSIRINHTKTVDKYL
jgi:hypothetical protein